MHLLAKLNERFFKRFGISYQPWEQIAFFGKTFRVVKGSFRQQADYDDGWLLALAHHSNLVFDIGCNIGQTSLLLLAPGIVKRIVLVDANPEALAVAAKNMIMNRLSHKASFVWAFVSERPGEEISFFTTHIGAAGSMYPSHARTASQIGGSYVVPTISVDWLCTWYNCVPDLIKVDVEGAEIKVLNGASSLAQKQQTRFMVEMHSNPELPMITNAEKVLEWCKSNRYFAWYLKEKTRLGSPREIEQRGRCHLLLLPEAETFPDYLRNIQQGSNLSDVLTSLENPVR